MKTSKLFSLLTLSLVLGSFMACNQECEDCPGTPPSADVTKPAISVVTPAQGNTFTGGDTIAFHAWISDNRELSQYRISIHSSSDGHTHGKNSGIAPYFEYDTIVTVGGVLSEQRLFIPIPVEAAAGPYHFIVSAVDKAGNEAEFTEVDINLANPSDTIAPLVTPVYPDFSASEVFKPFPAGQDTVQLRIIGQLTDASNGGAPGDLKAFEISLTLEGADRAVYSLTSTNLSGALVDLNQTLILRRTDMVHNAYYDLKIKAYDHSNNATEKKVKVKPFLN